MNYGSGTVEGYSDPMTSCALGRLAGNWQMLLLMHGHHLEGMTSCQKSNSVNRHLLTWRTNIISITFEMTEPWASLKSVAPTRRRKRTTRWV